jgi:hypothetical protein
MEVVCQQRRFLMMRLLPVSRKPMLMSQTVMIIHGWFMIGHQGRLRSSVINVGTGFSKRRGCIGEVMVVRSVISAQSI